MEYFLIGVLLTFVGITIFHLVSINHYLKEILRIVRDRE